MTENHLLSQVEHLVLAAVVRLGRDAYAVAIRNEIKRRTGIDLMRGTIYVTLSRLERSGLLESWFADPTPERGGKSKRYFKARPSALRLLRRTRRAYEEMWRGIEALKENA